MSEMVGETFVTITPVTDEAAFKEKTEAAVANATKGVEAEVVLTPTIDTRGVTQQIRTALNEIQTGIQTAVEQGRPLSEGEFETLAAEAQQAQQRLSELQAEIARTGTTSAASDAEITALVRDIERFSVALSQLPPVDLARALNADELSAGAQEATVQVRELAQQLVEARQQIAQGLQGAGTGDVRSSELELLGTRASNAARGLASVQQEIAQTGVLTATTEGEIAGLVTEIETLQQSLAQLAQTPPPDLAKEIDAPGVVAAVSTVTSAIAQAHEGIAALSAGGPVGVGAGTGQFDALIAQLDEITAGIRGAAAAGRDLTGEELQRFGNIAAVAGDDLSFLEKQIADTGAVAGATEGDMQALFGSIERLTAAAGEFGVTLEGLPVVDLNRAVNVEGAAEKVEGAAGKIEASLTGIADVAETSAANINASLNTIGTGQQPVLDPQRIEALTQARDAAVVSLREEQAAFDHLAASQALGLTTEAEVAAAKERLAVVSQAAARAELELAVATQSEEAAALKAFVAINQQAAAEEHLAGARSLRERAHGALLGEGGGLGGLLSPATLIRFTLAGLAIEGVFSALQHLEEGLKVDGEEAATLEGKIRNLSAELLRGDIIGGIEALFAKPPSDLSDEFAETTKKLREMEQQAEKISFRDAIDETEKFKDHVADASQTFDHGFTSLRGPAGRGEITLNVAATADEANRLSNELRTVALSSEVILPLIQKFPDPIKAALDPAEKLDKTFDALGKDAESTGRAFVGAARDATLLFQELEKLGRLDLASQIPLPTFGLTDLDAVRARTGDPTASERRSFSDQESIAQRTKDLNDNLAVAEKELAAAQQAQKNLADQNKGRAARRSRVIEAQTKVDTLTDQIAQQQEQQRQEDLADRQAIAASIASRTEGLQDDLRAAESAAEDARATEARLRGVAEGAQQRRRDVVEAETKVVAAQKALNEQQKGLVQDALDAEEERLQSNLALAQARDDGLANDRRALVALISFEHAKAHNRDLDLAVRREGVVAEAEYRQQLADLGEQDKEDLEAIKRLRLDNALALAKLTPGDEDNRAAEAAIAKQLEANLRAARGNKEKFEKARAELISFAGTLKDGDSGGGFTVENLFEQAGSDFLNFGSNISTSLRPTPLSPQEARGQFAASILGARDTIAHAAQAERQTQTGLLGEILAVLKDINGGEDPKVPKKGKGQTGSFVASDQLARAGAFNWGSG